MIGRSAYVRQVVELAGEEASRFGHRYVGPEHLLLGMLREDGSGAARILRTQGVDLEAARAALGRLAEQGVVPGPRPSDAELLGGLGIDLEALRRTTERAFGAQALGWAIREATRARRRGVGRVARTPLQDPPVLAVQALTLARERAKKLGHRYVGSELLLLGVLEDLTTRPPRCMSNPWVRRLHASVGLPEGYRSAAGPLLDVLGADPDGLRDAVLAALGGAAHQRLSGR
ncbi:MAG TPA: Clp protease N-terminal domain-containing protein [Actinomycetes bacterium]|nr:Clp protease N-terminal domain-containing protein [Actinomycetes bacterium]